MDRIWLDAFESLPAWMVDLPQNKIARPFLPL
jgi:hypothetical protein